MIVDKKTNHKAKFSIDSRGREEQGKLKAQSSKFRTK